MRYNGNECNFCSSFFEADTIRFTHTSLQTQYIVHSIEHALRIQSSSGQYCYELRNLDCTVFHSFESTLEVTNDSKRNIMFYSAATARSKATLNGFLAVAASFRIVDENIQFFTYVFCGYRK